MSAANVYRIKLVRDRRVTYRPSVDGTAEARAVARRMVGGGDRERFVAVMLDQRNRLVGATEVSVGSLSASLVHPREVFKAAILANAAGVLLAHNHPSGAPDPSDQDVEVTQRLVACGRMLGIEVVDHVVVGEGASTCLRTSRPELWRDGSGFTVA